MKGQKKHIHPTKPSKNISGADILLKSLEISGIELLVGYTGGAIMPTFDRLPDHPKLKFIMSRHEQGAAFIAQGYSRASGKLAPVLTTSGPGAMNTVTAVADAMMDNVPLMIISGQVATDVIGTDAFQESDVVGVMYPITKYATQPLISDQIPQAVVNCIELATKGRPGPVCLDIPKNVQIMLSKDFTKLPRFEFTPKSTNVTEDQLKKFERLLSTSSKPIILCGHGIVLSQAFDELLQFAESNNIPVSQTLHGVSGFPNSHELAMGMMGMHGEIEANRAIQNADLIIALGMRFDDRVTGKLEKKKKNAKVIHVDIDASEISKNVKVDLGIISDLKKFLNIYNNTCKQKGYLNAEQWLNFLNKQKELSRENYEEIFAQGTGPNGELLMSRVIHELSEFTEGKDNVVSDVGQHQMFTAKFYKFERPNTWFNSGGAGTMGFGLPAGIGVKLARPDEEVWVVTGDGGFQMNIQELGTVFQYKININILIMNNSFLGMVKQWQNLFYEDRLVMTQLINPNFEKIAEAYNIPYKKVITIDQIKPSLIWAKAMQGPTIIEYICDKKEIVLPMVPNGYPFEDMIINLKGKK